MCSPKILIDKISPIEPNSPQYGNFIKPEHNLGRYFSFWASVPFLDWEWINMDFWKETFFRSWPVNLVYTKVAVSPITKSNGSTCSADLLHCNDMIQVSHPWPPVFGIGSDPQEAHVAQFSPEVFSVGKVICFVNCVCMGCKLLRTKVEKKFRNNG